MQVGPKLPLMPQQAAETKPAAPDKAKDAAREFEAVFLTQAVEEMMRSVDLGSFGGGHAEETWRSFLAKAFADEIAAQGLTGISDSVERAIGAYRTAQKD
ncbi:rod-binding protein [Tranquillimonas alkanivorans]|uniref:Rod binding protein n=1 Tax=Tranquillimonas alkanivorans TaxID=441119 RepID=A0A1I5S4T0_9RHOB|nr:rod-binding protein [Tranquillimonas alkanivorans]SFP65667.1 Rod binding protein [Tranquillimonas alkanivorans]